MSNTRGLLIKVAGNGEPQRKALGTASGGDVVEILRIPPREVSQGVAPEKQGHTWLRVGVDTTDGGTAWDLAHASLGSAHAFAAAGVGPVEMVEPDLEQQWLYSDASLLEGPAKNAEERCQFEDQDSRGGCSVGPGVGWNLGGDFSGLAGARSRVQDKMAGMRIAHLDTGYDPKHITLPSQLLKDLQRNFVDKEFPNDATDHTPPGNSLFRNRGHGTATLNLLAGNRLDGQSMGWPDFKDYIGGAPLAGVIPVRIADWVVRLTTATMVQGFEYSRAKSAHVLCMSMGGVSSAALADAVNLAYEAGIVMVTAAGNNLSHLPTPKTVVFPARYGRVLAACGVMADGRAYSGLSFGTMQGNYGPPSKMSTALGAYTPNVPWAKIDCRKIVDMDGSGTSAATPQIAAAVALWLAEYWDIVKAYPQPWMRVEAVRLALFDSAAHSTAKMGPQETLEKLGRGVLHAAAALEQKPADKSALIVTPPADASWSWLNLIFGGGISAPTTYDARARAMFHLELTQMAQQNGDVEAAIPDPDQPAVTIPASQRARYLEAALEVGQPSQRLRQYLQSILQKRATVLDVPSATPARLKRRVVNPPEPKRRLRVFALDPSLGKRLESSALNETTLSVPWDDVLPWEQEPEKSPKRLRAGPVGQYLAVVDVDPASNRVYEPVNLNSRALLAQDGWPPSEGNPQFHQQMVYAVGMTTIGHFERALGRRALWAAHTPPHTNEPYQEQFVQRLRIYPHAFRGSNAYYSPNKKALLFGYFPADSQDSDATAPGSMVFACLSSDIVAHEMTHALLDGLHRRFEEASNPDVPAFHEGFADIVALFQHFTIQELVRFEIGRSHADLSAGNLLSGLAQQFGEGSSRGGPLRNYLDPAMKALKYSAVTEPHTRGSILVYAVYEAFLKLVTHRTADLLRIATGGTGVLPGGALHPDLVDRLTREVSETAADILQMCIRALDYCPPVDITFGEYLRAIITADRDLSETDLDGRRVAFMQAFRNRGILPGEMRTVSEETLAWTPLDLDVRGPGPSGSWSQWLFDILKSKEIETVLDWDLESDRKISFHQNNKNRLKVRDALIRLFAKDRGFYSLFGLVDKLPRYDEKGQPLAPAPSNPSSSLTPTSTFEVHSARPARRVKPNGTYQTDIVVVINQRRPEPIDGVNMNNGWFWFRGGATLILDTRAQQVRYIVVKNMTSRLRLERQRATAAGSLVSPLRALYFGSTAHDEPFAMMHADLNEYRNG